MSSSKPVFGKLKEVEIILSSSTIRAAEIHRFMIKQGEVLPSAEAQGGEGTGQSGKPWRGKRVIGPVASAMKSTTTVVRVSNDQC